MIKRLLALALAVFMLFAAASCGKKDDATEDTSGNFGDPDSLIVGDHLPEKDMEGFELKIVQNDTYASAKPLDFQELGDAVLDSEIFARNREIEQRFNCKLVVEKRDYVLVDDITNYAMAGEAPFDLVYVISWGASKLNDVVIDLNEIPYIKLDEAWWTPASRAIGSAAGKQFAGTSSFSLSSLAASRGFLFNKTLYESVEPGKSMYDYLDSNEWTFETFYRISSDAYSDVDKNKIVYGIGGTAVKFTYMSFIVGSGISFVEKTDDDMLDFTLDDKLPQYIDRLMDFAKLGDGKVYYNIDPADMETDVSEGNPIKGTALFQGTTINKLAAQDLRNSNYEFGFMPVPKYDSSQSEYYSPVAHYETMVIMNTVPTDRYENIGILLEALSFHSHHGVMKTYLEETVTFRYSPDLDCMEVMNLILDTRTFESGEILLVNEYNDLIKSFYLAGGGGNISSGVATHKSKIEKKINSYNESF